MTAILQVIVANLTTNLALDDRPTGDKFSILGGSICMYACIITIHISIYNKYISFLNELTDKNKWIMTKS